MALGCVGPPPTGRLDCIRYGGVLRVSCAAQSRSTPWTFPKTCADIARRALAEAIPKPVYGDPDEAKICTSHVETQNLTMRMCMRRLTRLTNGFSKKWDNLRAALALHFAWYNFCRKHITLKGATPAMAAGLTDRAWRIDELLG